MNNNPAQNNTENNQKLITLAQEAVQPLGFEVLEVQQQKQGGEHIVLIRIDRLDEQPVTMDDLTKASRAADTLFDEADPIPGEYRLEVSSPGMARPLYSLDHFTRYQGHQVALKLRLAFDGRRKFQGLLAGVEGDEVLLQMEGEEYCFPIESIDAAHVVPQFEE